MIDTWRMEREKSKMSVYYQANKIIYIVHVLVSTEMRIWICKLIKEVNE